MSPKSFLELVPNYLNVCREGGPMMGPPDACRALQLVSEQDSTLNMSFVYLKQKYL